MRHAFVGTGVAVLLAAATPAALAQSNPIVGVYGDAGGCNRARGGAEYTDMVTVLRPNSVEHYESVCQITTIELLGTQPQRLNVTCRGEGESWQTGYFVWPLPGEDGYALRSDRAPAFQIEVRRCQ